MSDKIEVNTWSKIVTLTKEQVIRFQLLVHCNLMGYTLLKGKGRAVSINDIECLTLLGLTGPADLTSFCEQVTKTGMFASPQSTRNFLVRMKDKNLIEKKGKYRKIIYLHPDMKIQTEGTIVLDIKALYRDQPIRDEQ